MAVLAVRRKVCLIWGPCALRSMDGIRRIANVSCFTNPVEMRTRHSKMAKVNPLRSMLAHSRSEGFLFHLTFVGDLDFYFPVFQINSIHWPSCNNGEPPCGLEGNLACAKTVFLNAHSTWRPWSACSFCGCDTA